MGTQRSRRHLESSLQRRLQSYFKGSAISSQFTRYRAQEKAWDNRERVIYNRKAGWWKLPYWKFLLLHHNLDVMHIEKNICDNLLGTLLKLEGKPKDKPNSRIDLVAMGIRPRLHPYQDGAVVKTPPAFYVLTPAH